MLIPLTVTLSLLVQVCTAALYDVAFARLTNNQAVVGSYSELLCNTIFSNGDVLVSGYTKGLVGYDSAGGADFLLQRYSETGTLLWTKVFGGAGVDSIESVSLDSTDNIYATGYTSSSTPSQSQDVYIAKFDSSGNTIYSKTIGGTAGEQGLSIFVDKARGVFYVSGYTQSLTFYDVARTGTTDAFLLKLDSTTGAVIKNTQNGAAGSATTFLALTLDSTGAPWVSGRTNAPSYFSQPAYGNNDIVIQKFSSDGVSQVVHRIGGNSNDFSTGMATDTNDNVYTSGWASTAIEGQTSNGGLDIFVTKCNSAGTKLWTKLLGSGGTDSSLGMTVDSTQGLIYITGYLQTASFYGAVTTGSTILSSYLLVLSSSDGSYVTSTVYGPSMGINLAVQGTRLYMTGNAGQVFQGQNSSSVGGTGFVMRLETSDVLPIATPSVSPTTHPSGAPTTSAPTPVPSTFEPTASPTAVCMQWALGDYGESCSATCSKLSRTCKDKYLKEIINQESFYAIVGSAVSVRSGGAVGTTETFCSQTTDSAVKVGGPAALSIVLSSEDHHLPVRTSCTYPTSTADATLGCDAVLPLHNYRRFCPCVDHNCDGAWYLGYSGDSCDATCTSAGGVCDAEPLNDIVNPDAFSAMVASATVVETNEIIGESSAAYCHEGINILPLAPAPAVITLTFGSTNETLCAYPTSVSNLQGSCDMAFTDLPAQRFCNCKVTGPASHPHRMLLAAENAKSAAVQPKIAKAEPTPRLRGKAF